MIRKRTNLTASQRKQRLFWMLFGIILFGAALHGGLLLWKKMDTMFWTRLAGNFFETDCTISALFLEASSGSLLFLMLFFLLGFSAVGQPFTLLLLCGYGFCVGGDLMMNCVTILRIVCLLPYVVPVSVLMTVAVRESLRFSGMFSVYGFQDDPAEQMRHQMRMYGVRFIVLVLLSLIWSLLYSLAFYTLGMAVDVN